MTTDLDPLIRCDGCGHPLAAIVAGMLYIQHRGRKILAGQVISIECDRCSTVWTNPAAHTPLRHHHRHQCNSSSCASSASSARTWSSIGFAARSNG